MIWLKNLFKKYTLLIISLLLIFLFASQTAFSQTFYGGSAELPAYPNTTGVANPYPATIEVAGLEGNIASITIALDIYHAWPDDVDILLVGPTGASSVLMSDAGGGTDLGTLLDGFEIIFDQDALSIIPDALAITEGTYKPADYATVGEIFNAPAPAGVHTANLKNFEFTNPNGTWSLYAKDDLGGDKGNLFGWSITIVLAEPCIDPPVAGVTELMPANICDGFSFTASLPETTSGEGQLYQWQISNDNIFYMDIAGANSDTYSDSPLESAYYRCEVTCGATSSFSDPAYLNINETPTGDSFSDPLEINTLPFIYEGNNLASNCWTNTIGYRSPDVWFTYTASCNGTIDISVCTDALDSWISLKDSSGANLAFNDDYTMDGCYYLSSGIFDFEVIAGNTYYIMIEGWNFAEGSFTLTVNESNTSPLSISPAGDISVCFGEYVLLSATAGYDSYQWYKNSELLLGATSMHLSTKKPGFYHVEAAIGECNYVSEVQAIEVSQPSSVRIKAAGGQNDLCATGNVYLLAQYIGVSVQWFLNGDTIDGAISNSYLATEAGDYKCVSVWGDCMDESNIINVFNSCRIMDETDSEILHAYPNPTQSELFVEVQFISELTSSAVILLYNSLGQQVYSKNFPVNNGELNEQITFDNLKPGIYMLLVRSDEGSKIKQVVIQ